MTPIVDDSPPPVRLPISVKWQRPIETGVAVIIVLAAAVAPFAAWDTPKPFAVILGAALVLIGALGVSRWRGDVAVLTVASGPVISAILGAEPIHSWSMACFAAFLLAFRGTPALLVGGVLGLGNAVAAGYAAGTVLPSRDSQASIAAAVAVAMAAAGGAMFANRRYLLELQRRVAESEAGREAAIRARVVEERVRIARDLHDSVGHEVAVVNMRLGAAEVRLPPGSDEAREDIVAARGAIQGILRETQEILKVLRAGEVADSGASYELIEEMVAEFRTGGLVITADLAVPETEIPSQAGAAAFRVVQETLTNAHRHSTGSVALSVRISAGVITIMSTNLIRHTEHADGLERHGQGLIGMRERVEAAGGSLQIDVNETMFTMKAEIPLMAEKGRAS